MTTISIKAENVLQPLEILQRYFGYDSFRPQQKEIIESIISGKDNLVLMPTGGGKSICYQIPAMFLEGTCIVVSPLISLMKDQVDGLQENGIRAAFINSSQSQNEQTLIENSLFNDSLDLLYVSPEKLISDGFMNKLKHLKINLFAVDEAHCISSWGHDFRPEYVKLAQLKTAFKGTPVVALTATADKITRRDITKQLALQDPMVFISSFDRPNISLEARPGQKRIEQIIEFIKERKGRSGIIYCLSRKNTEDLGSRLQKAGIKAMCYHAGMPAGSRAGIQEQFINDNLQVVCATIAFGMGIDKSNVSWIIHYNLPQNVEGYYQEIGRAGRDGSKAESLLFYSYRDYTVLRDLLSKNASNNTDVKLSKLERMLQFAETQTCRRKVLLSYFGEDLNEDCGNCDICQNPPQYIDGKVIAQKAMSAVLRLNERVGVNMLVDVLRGSGRKELYDRGFQNIKTYGAGRDHTNSEWHYFLQQIINNGLCEIAYDQKNVLKVTEAGKEVLLGKRSIQLASLAKKLERQKQLKEKSRSKTKTQTLSDELFEKLRGLRKRMAQAKGVPPYIVASDKTLIDMSNSKPMTEQAMLKVQGMGERKMHLYGERFLTCIKEYVMEKGRDGQKVPGASQLISYDLFQRGISIPDIAKERGMAEGTIQSHLIQLYEDGENIDISKFISKKEIDVVTQVVKHIQTPFKLKDVFDALDGKYGYDKIKFALAYMGRNRN